MIAPMTHILLLPAASNLWARAFKIGLHLHATIAGKMRRFRIRVLAGDRVTLEVSPYDLTRGRITFRHKS